MNTLDEELLIKIQQDINENKMLETLYQEYKIEGLLRYNEHNLADKIKDNPFISEQFRLLYLKESQNLKRVEDIFESAKGTEYDRLMFEDEKTLSKTEIEKYYLPKNEKLNKLKMLINKQQLRTEFFESVWKALDKQAWLMKLFSKEQEGM